MKNPSKLFPLILTSNLDETKAFYVDKAGFSVTYDMPGYLQVRYGAGDDAPELAFMKPDAFPDGQTRPAFGGQGVIVSIPTTNADDKFAALKKAGVEPVAPVSDKPWGWRSFPAADPNGLVLDFFHVVAEPPPGANAAS